MVWDIVYTGEFYCLNVSDSHWQGVSGEFEKAVEEFLRGDISSFNDTPVDLIQIIFEENQDENGRTYLFYHSIKTVEKDVKSVVPYEE